MRQIVLWGGMLAAFMTLARGSSAQAPGPSLDGRPVLAVAGYDYAHVPENVLVSGEREASRIFRRAGVDLVWVNCLPEPEIQSHSSCQGALPHFHVEMRILPRNLGADLRLHADTFGVAEACEDGIGSVSYVFYDRVEQRTENAELRATLLGDLMAHELGHLLLGPRSHSPRGIMCAIWGTQELRSAAQGALLFEPPQSKLIRDKLVLKNGQEIAHLSSPTDAPEVAPLGPAGRAGSR